MARLGCALPTLRNVAPCCKRLRAAGTWLSGARRLAAAMSAANSCPCGAGKAMVATDRRRTRSTAASVRSSCGRQAPRSLLRPAASAHLRRLPHCSCKVAARRRARRAAGRLCGAASEATWRALALVLPRRTSGRGFSISAAPRACYCAWLFMNASCDAVSSVAGAGWALLGCCAPRRLREPGHA